MCKEPGCESYVYMRGWCRSHYNLFFLLPKYDARKKLAPIPKISKKKRVIIANQGKIKQSLAGKPCIFCGSEATDPVHVIRQSDSIELQDNPLNIVPGCRFHHDIFDNGDARTLKNIDVVLKIMKGLDELYYNRFVLDRLSD